LDIQLIEGGRGVFEVSVNRGLKVFSKKKTGRFPVSSIEVSQAIRDAIADGRL
jgi:predicted Rdx family selenoprotein